MAPQRQRRKTTFALDEAVLQDAKEVARESDFRSLNAFVEKAIVEMIKRYREGEIKRQLLKASRDPLFLKDIAEVQGDFQYADRESLQKDS